MNLVGNLDDHLPDVLLTLQVFISLLQNFEWENFIDDWMEMRRDDEPVHVFEPSLTISILS